ncbi:MULTISPECIES: hypothetical protein [Shewanella]|jgi:hypothetical protein|uniref:Uncharacterized protein n=1 Tax=Shewanella psychromarinicola TaxID=2487742 RepID=A0A3N4E9B7_9GAMM|nr:hypothetical protein [Shewanella psychromarinicola]AZG34665.1 hypothetical protein EGC80_06840 [Shewanella psychromarinicola]MCL1083066.1 hypothetical protein [Shewanella psychromarinicola]RPA33548.1 hypothetical protein EGC77_09530 [Shewanella psychromarinicola]
MYNTAKKQVWFGELRTSKGNTIVVHDNQLPEASPGRIYLYNTIRNTIVEYVEDIVKVNLYDLDDEQTKVAIAELNEAWKAERAEFMLKHQSRIDLSKVPDTAPSRKAKPVPEPDEIVDTDDDIPELDDDDDDDSFDEMGDSVDD